MSRHRHAPEKLLRALSELERARSESPSMERRSFPRVPARGEAELLAIDQTRPKEPVPIQLRDIAWGGFGFICQVPLEECSHWRALFLQRGQQVAQQTLIVRHCTRVAGDLWLVGSQACIDNGVVALLGVDRIQLDP